MLESPILEKFSDYLARAYHRQSSLATVVFQNQPQPLKELYIPLTVQTNLPKGETKSIQIKTYPEGFLPAHQRVLLIDDAGMGKSTLLKFLFLSCIEQEADIPVFIELRRLTADKSILDIIYDDLSPINENLSRDLLLRLIQDGDFVFFLDGYDEIPFADRDLITKNLQDFIFKASNNLFILSSRQELALSSFSHFQTFTINSLSRAESFELLRKYDRHGTLSKQLIKELENQIESVQEFLGNPMLVSLLYKAYDYKRDIPLKKHVFYRQVFDALFDEHDATKPLFKRQKYSKLDKDDFESVLRALGFITLTKGEVGYSKDELLSHLNKARQYTGQSYADSDLLLDLLRTVPLFASEGDYYRWKHKSLQEYFAARYISCDERSKSADIFQKMITSHFYDRYANVLDLCYDIDKKTFERTLILNAVNAFLQYYENSYGDFTNTIEQEDLHLRKILCFDHTYVIYPSSFFSPVESVKNSFG